MLDKISDAGVIIAITLVIILTPIIIYDKYKKQSRIMNYRKEMQNSISLEQKNRVEEILKEANAHAGNAILLTILLTVGAALALVWLYYNVKNVMVFFYIFGLVIIYMIIYSFIKSNYSSEFKNISVKKIIKEYDETLDYSSLGDFTNKEYYECDFIELGVISYYGDFIKKNNGLRLTHVQVHSARRENYDPVFSGVFASIPIKNIQCKIILDEPERKSTDYQKFVSVNEEFNKYFSVFADNISKAEQILTPEFMEALINIKKETLVEVDIRLFNNILYMRFSTGAGILASFFNAKQEKESVYSYIGTIDYVIKIVEKAKDCIDKINL